jgi:hypothetical protein
MLIHIIKIILATRYIIYGYNLKKLCNMYKDIFLWTYTIDLYVAPSRENIQGHEKKMSGGLTWLGSGD